MRHSTLSSQKGTSIDSIWLLIAGLVIGATLLSAFGLMDWTPTQAEVPESTTPLTESQVQEAHNNGSLQIHPY